MRTITRTSLGGRNGTVPLVVVGGVVLGVVVGAAVVATNVVEVLELPVVVDVATASGSGSPARRKSRRNTAAPTRSIPIVIIARSR